MEECNMLRPSPVIAAEAAIQRHSLPPATAPTPLPWREGAGG